MFQWYDTPIHKVACVRIRHHTYVSICQQDLTLTLVVLRDSSLCQPLTSVFVLLYWWINWPSDLPSSHTSWEKWFPITSHGCTLTFSDVMFQSTGIRQDMSVYVSTCHHTSTYVIIRQEYWSVTSDMHLNSTMINIIKRSLSRVSFTVLTIGLPIMVKSFFKLDLCLLWTTDKVIVKENTYKWGSV